MNATSADARPVPASDAAEATSEAPSGRGGVVLAVAMGLGNLLSYVFVLILTRALGPAGFGAYSALITLGIVLVIPAGALQVVIARRWAHPSLRSSGLGLAVRVGVALSVATMLASPGVDALFHLGGFEPTIAMAFMLLPMTLTGAYQGVLLGSGAIARLAALYVVTAATRVAGALGCAAAGANVTEVFVVMALTAWCAAAFGLWASRDALVGVGAGSDGLAREMWRSNSTLAAFTALTNVDVVLVRHFLAPETSGAYGLASTFARAMCWGTQFLALLIVPRLAASSASASPAHAGANTRATNGTRALWRAAGFVVALGVTGCVVGSLLDADAVIASVGGHAFDGNGSLVIACLALGTVWALAQLWLFSQMAGDDTRLGMLTWVMVAVELVAGWLWWHDSVWQVVTLAAACAGVVVVAGAWRSRSRRVTHVEDAEDLLVLDHTS